MPSFGAIPSEADRKKKAEEEADAEDRKEDIIAQLLRKDAAEVLNAHEVKEPIKVRTRARAIFCNIKDYFAEERENLRSCVAQENHRLAVALLDHPKCKGSARDPEYDHTSALSIP